MPSGLIDPIAQYDTHREGHSVITGFVYRGERLHDLKGRFIFGDFSRLFNFPAGRITTADCSTSTRKRQKGTAEDPRIPDHAEQCAEPRGAGVREDAEGEVYVLGNVTGVPFGQAGW